MVNSVNSDNQNKDNKNKLIMKMPCIFVLIISSVFTMFLFIALFADAICDFRENGIIPTFPKLSGEKIIINI